MHLSIVVPVYNEEKNVVILYKELKTVLGKFKKDYEIIFVDDGSTDSTFKELERLNKNDRRLRIIRFRKNFGQTAALDAGFKHAKGKVIVSIDADLQNDPTDIPKLLIKLEEDYDVVSGWRKNRKDTTSKNFASRGAHKLRRLLFKDQIHDSGCTLKAYRRECFEGLDLYGEMHRFIPALLSWKGFRITEIVVKHRARKYGKTKYSWRRIVKGFLDMLVVKFWMQYSTRPVHLFGSLGLLLGSIGFLSALYLAIQKLVFRQSIGNRPLLLLSVLFIIVGLQFLMFGILADIMIKDYYKKDRPYKIAREI